MSRGDGERGGGERERERDRNMTRERCTVLYVRICKRKVGVSAVKYERRVRRIHCEVQLRERGQSISGEV
jgi:hypothetical protein